MAYCNILSEGESLEYQNGKSAVAEAQHIQY